MEEFNKIKGISKTVTDSLKKNKVDTIQVLSLLFQSRLTENSIEGTARACNSLSAWIRQNISNDKQIVKKLTCVAAMRLAKAYGNCIFEKYVPTRCQSHFLCLVLAAMFILISRWALCAGESVNLPTLSKGPRR